MNPTFPSIIECPLWETEKKEEGIMAAIYLNDFCGGNYGVSTRSYNTSEQETTCRKIVLEYLILNDNSVNIILIL